MCWESCFSQGEDGFFTEILLEWLETRQHRCTQAALLPSLLHQEQSTIKMFFSSFRFLKIKQWLYVSLFLGKSSAWWPINHAPQSKLLCWPSHGSETSAVKGGFFCTSKSALTASSWCCNEDGHSAQCGYGYTKCRFWVYPCQHSGSRSQSACVTHLFFSTW